MENTKQELRWTPMGKDYWGEDAEYSKFLEEKWEELVPAHGEAETVHGELLRCFGKLNHDYGNNGNGNAREMESGTCGACWGDGEYDDDICDECGGSGEEPDAEVTMNSHFESLLNYIADNLRGEGSHDAVEDVRNLILGDDHSNFSDECVHKYTKLGDMVAHQILTTENEPREKTGLYE